MNQMNDPRALAGLVVVVAAALLAGCPWPSPKPGCTPMDATSTYAVYTASGNTTAAVEETKGLQGRCIAAVNAAPPEPTAPPASAPVPTCATGFVPAPPTAYYAEYFNGADTRLQIEDLQGVTGRCIKPILPTGGSACPPPAGYHTTVIRGQQYCVPN